MRPRILCILVALCFGMFSACNAYATESAAFIPDKLQTTYYSQKVLIIFPSGHSVTNPGGCTHTTAYALDPTSFGDDGHKERVSLALAALLNGKQIVVDVAGCSTALDYPLVTYVRIVR
jgi:hypothetical protein